MKLNCRSLKFDFFFFFGLHSDPDHYLTRFYCLKICGRKTLTRAWIASKDRDDRTETDPFFASQNFIILLLHILLAANIIK